MAVMKRAVCAALALILLTVAVPAAAEENRVDTAYQNAAVYLCGAEQTARPGSVGGEWFVLGLLRGGYDVSGAFYEDYDQLLTDFVTEQNGVLSQRKYTEYSRVVLTLTAMGKDPSDVGGYNLLLPLGDYDKTVLQGISGPTWALIALDSGGYPVPENPGASTQATRERYLENILQRQLADGGFALAGTAADPDTTAMALLALARYQDREDVKTATDMALDCLSSLQQADGGYVSWGISCAESTAQVILALCALDVPVDEERFVKNGVTLVDNLLSYQTEDGGFAHTAGSDEADRMASEQVLLALAALRRSAAGYSFLFEIDDPARLEKQAADIWSSRSAERSLIFYYRKNAPVWSESP